MGPPTEDTDVSDESPWPPGLTASNTPGRSAGTLWRHALTKLREVDLDPWIDFSTFDLPTQSATRHRYSAIKKKWVVDQVHIKMETNPFDRGAMRECFRLKKLSHTRSSSGDDWQHASNYVAKRYISNVDRQVYFDDVRLQMEAKLWGEAFNRQNPPKKVDIFQLSVLEISKPKSTADSGSNASRIDYPYAPVNSGDPPTCLLHIERFMEGEYRKYNSNTGFVDEQLRNTPQAFSHFTFERSGHRLLVVDIQGVGDLYTDPQIHTADGVGYSDGNLGPRGMAYFFHSHRCNPLCSWLSLAPFDLAPSELIGTVETSLGVAADIPKHPDAKDNNDGNCNGLLSNSTADGVVLYKSEHAPTGKPSKSMLNLGPRRRSVSFNSNLNTSFASMRFGPTVARSSENMSSCSSMQRLRIPSCELDIGANRSPESASLLLQLGCPSLSNLTLGCGGPGNSQFAKDVSSSLSALHLGPDSIGAALINSPQQTVDCAVINKCKPTHPVDKLELGNGSSRLLYSLDHPWDDVKMSRGRTASGDSGYFGRLGLLSTTKTTTPSPTAFSNTVWFDYSQPSSPGGVHSHTGAGSRSVFSTSGDDFPLSAGFNINSTQSTLVNGSCFNRASIPVRARRRNISESSDIDGEEDHRLAGNLLHQLMHESHKPSCTDHPTNLDQEIGHSILGQIHHELARLHEAGRFLPGRKGGWSCAGLGGLRMDDDDDDGDGDDDVEHDSADAYRQAQTGTDEVTGNPSGGDCSLSDQTTCDSNDVSPRAKSQATPSVDWEAVLFHERHAAQLGCLEAMIVMAHYYLGLPTQLLFDCPIKPDQANLRSGVDYLWRAAEGGDRRCMILLARYLDVSATLLSPSPGSLTPDNFLLIPALQSTAPESLPSTAPDAWSEAVAWYDRAVVTASCGHDPNGTATDDGLDAEGRYDAAEDLLPIYRILARMAEMYYSGGFGLKQNYQLAVDLFNQAGELASSARQGRIAAEYFELAEEAYGKIE